MTNGRQPSSEQFARALLRAQDRASWLYFERFVAQQAAREAQAHVVSLENSIAYRLGVALVAATKSLGGLLALPGALLGLMRQWSSRQSKEVGPAASAFVWPAAPIAELSESGWLHRKPNLPDRVEDIRIVAVVDEFTRAAFAPDCHWLDLPAEDFEPILDDFSPHILLVESAWRGKSDEWRHKVHPLSRNLCYLVDCCRRRGIRTVFWNKEDPSHFEAFLESARLFDHVFTTDSDCIPRYREALGHDRVHLLSFCCQPRMHNPIESGERKIAACFAGSWYRSYADRSIDFDHLVAAVSQVVPVEIYDRNHQRKDPDFEFPSRYKPMIRGSLPYSRIDEAYKGYRYAITINTIKNSPSMLARRVYELLASNTITISNPSEALARVFGTLVVREVGDRPLVTRLRALEDRPEARHKLQLLGLREVLQNHTSAHRLAEMANLSLGGRISPPKADIVVLAGADSTAEAAALIQAFDRQKWPEKRLMLMAGPAVSPEAFVHHPRIKVVSSVCAQDCLPSVECEGSWLAMLHPDDYYGPNYLTDLALSTLYAMPGFVGKSYYYAWAERFGVTESGYSAYRNDAPLWYRATIGPSSAFAGHTLDELLRAMRSETEPSLTGLAIDRFSYCRDAAKSGASDLDAIKAIVDVCQVNANQVY